MGVGSQHHALAALAPGKRPSTHCNIYILTYIETEIGYLNGTYNIKCSEKDRKRN
jgi:hypothetical protein